MSFSNYWFLLVTVSIGSVIYLYIKGKAQTEYKALKEDGDLYK